MPPTGRPSESKARAVRPVWIARLGLRFDALRLPDTRLLDLPGNHLVLCLSPWNRPGIKSGEPRAWPASIA